MSVQEEQQSNSPSSMDGARIISYNFSEGERPGGIKIRAKIRVVSGRQAAALNERQAEAIRELLIWARQQRTAAEQRAVVGLVPVALRRAHLHQPPMQDPVESLSRQLRMSRERLPEGFVITRYYWDVESGRDRPGPAQPDRHVAEVRRRRHSPRRRNGRAARRDPGREAAVRGGDLREHRADRPRHLRRAPAGNASCNAAGVLILATDEPIDAAAPDDAVHLVRRVKQGIAEYFRYNLKTQMWEGLKEYAISGHNTGRCPYGYPEDRTPHPNPMKANMGATRARLITDPERGPWVTRCSSGGCTRSCHPTASPAGWTTGSPRARARHPVEPRHRPHHPGQPQVHRQGRHRPHPQRRRPPRRAEDTQGPPRALDMGRRRQRAPRPGQHGTVGSRPGRRPRARQRPRPPGRRPAPRLPATVPHPLRPVPAAHVRQAQPRPAPARRTYYWVCPHNPNNPRHAAKHPDHVRASVPDHDITAAVDHIINGLLGHDRAAMLAALLPATQAEADQRNQQRAEELRRPGHPERDRAERPHHPARPDGQRHQPRRQRHARAHHRPVHRTVRRAAKPSRPSWTPSPPASRAADDPALIDELPYAAACIADAPDERQSRASTTRSTSRPSTAPTASRPPYGQPSPTPPPASSPP